ncbi:MAG TPA: methylated-DNA--[protein]-cysteine S-methyltransferase [Candidatus Margulisiibacteriota bacterium]|nr:methylated-DNA--[protein]-cysteine S-methyltransferase [Candidatus Margulisiibacteriota bacterium]
MANDVWLKERMRAGQDRVSDAAGADGRVSVCVRTLKTPVGVLRVAASEDSVVSIELPRRRSEPALERWLRSHIPHSAETPVLRAALAQLREYFAGKRRCFDVPADPAGTEFQRRVWSAVAAIPFGETTSYGTIAAALGGMQRARAVGAAVGANPIPIVIPCHRVVGADGSLTGYGGGLRMKVWLLRHEGVLLA